LESVGHQASVLTANAELALIAKGLTITAAKRTL
jgi:hypothetical protein